MSQDGAVGPFFEGNMPPQKKHPKKWLGTPSHSLNAVNSSYRRTKQVDILLIILVNRIQAMAPRLAPLFGVYFLWGCIVR